MSTAASRPRGKQSHLSKGPIEKDEKKSKEYEFNTKHLDGKAQVCDLDLKSKYEWGWY